jgi:hypothetical protein
LKPLVGAFLCQEVSTNFSMLAAAAVAGSLLRGSLVQKAAEEGKPVRVIMASSDAQATPEAASPKEGQFCYK